MDKLNLQIALSSHSLPDSNDVYNFEHPYPQRFSLPYPIMKYIFKNPTSKAWKKLIQTCKYFYSKNSIYPVQNLEAFKNEKWEGDKEVFHLKDLKSKLWVYNSIFGLHIDQFRNTISSLIPKIAKSELGVLEFESQNLSWDEYQVLTSSGTVEWLNLFNVTINYSDGSIVTVDKLLQNFKNTRSISIGSRSNISSFFKADTVKNMIKILSTFTKLRSFYLSGLTVTFDFASFIDFLLENQYARIALGYDRDVHFSNAYKEMLQNFNKRIKENPPRKIPDIYF